jgi:uncharacterized protein YprB with RNaseH-like and TPR domain
MIKREWHMLSVAWKWKGEEKIHCKTQVHADKVWNDKELLKAIHEQLCKADYIVGHNVKAFDLKKLNARFILNGLRPATGFKIIDTLSIARKHFAFTSNKLEHLAKTLKCKNRKLTRRKYDGFDLWDECLKGNKDAFRELAQYNMLDVKVLEEVYDKLMPFDNKVSFHAHGSPVCTCGNKNYRKNGYQYTSKGKFQRWECVACGKEYKSGPNLLSKEQKNNIKVGV